jgi:hypothetical protein
MKTLLIGNGYWGSIVQEKLKKQTDLSYIANSKDNIDDTLDKTDADYVFVCSPTHTHYEIVKKCIQHHKNIFCEKPFTGKISTAIELFDLAEKNNVKLFVDNIFLYRNEFLNIPKKSFTKIEFRWSKFEEKFKENLFNTLLYHDLYLLLELSNDEWNINYCDISDDKLSLSLFNNIQTVEFNYDRSYIGNKEKKIIIDDNIIDFSYPLNDPLSEIINNLKSNNIDFEKNKIITKKTINLLNKIQNGCLLHTSGNIK